MSKIRSRCGNRKAGDGQLDLLEIITRKRWEDLPWQARRIGRRCGVGPSRAAEICRLACIGPEDER